jgi:hypothetical protein
MEPFGVALRLSIDKIGDKNNISKYIKKKHDKIVTKLSVNKNIMSSLAGKMSLLVDEYNHSKTSPAYRKLSIKYKALKKSNQELIQLLTSLFAGNSNDDCIRRASRRSQTDTYQDDILEEEIETILVPHDVPQNNTDDLFEEREDDEEEEEERDLESCNTEEEEEEEEGEAECDDEEETEDPDIKEQIIQEQVAESFAIKEEPQDEEPQDEEPQTVTVEEEVVEYEEVEEEEVVEYEEVEEEVVEEEVEETEEVVEYEEVEEEEAGVYEIEVKGTRYYTTNEKDGIVYAVLDDDDVGDEVGKFVNGKLVLN